MNRQEFVAELSGLRPSSTFLAVKSYSNEAGEVADYSIAFHISYASALQRSIRQLEELPLTSELEQEARAELLTSFRKSLTKIEEVPVEEIEDGYTRFFDDRGNYVKGVKLHTKTDTLHLYGLVVHKRILIPGNYKTVNSSQLTIAKNKLKYLTSCGKFRQFRMTPGQVESISVNNISLLPPGY
jgi:hypothetical protein